MEIFKPRLKAPTEDNRWYGKDNPAYKTKWSMFDKHKNNKVDSKGKYGNCTHYVIGRFQELMNNRCRFKEENACKFYQTGIEAGYDVGDTPRLGSVIVYKNSGAGHVAIVEKIYKNGDILLSMSGWQSYLFRTLKVKKKNNYQYNSHKFVGFVYCPRDFREEETIDKYLLGVYQVVSPRYVRTGAGTEYSIKKVSQLTKDGQKNCVSKNKNANAQYKKDTKFDVLEVKYASNKSIWAKTPSGYVCLESSKGTIYCKRVN